MYKSYIHTINFYEKNYKTNKYANKLKILHQNTKKLTF